MGLFSNKSTPVIGLDVSSTAVKLLELSGTPGKYHVESYAVQPLPPNAVVEKNITEVEAVGEAIGMAVKRAQTKNKYSALAVSGSAVITKVITMQANLSSDELAGQIELEADQYIPYSLEEVNLDFEVIGPSESDPDQIDVLLAASRSENVDVRQAVAEIGGIICKIVDVEAFAVENAFGLIAQEMPTGGMGETIALVDIGATMTTLSVLSDLKIIYTREQVFGGKQLTEEIQRRYGLTYEEAGLAKRQGGLPDNYGPEVLIPFNRVDGPTGQPLIAVFLFFQPDCSGRPSGIGWRLCIHRGCGPSDRRENRRSGDYRQPLCEHVGVVQGQTRRAEQ